MHAQRRVFAGADRGDRGRLRHARSPPTGLRQLHCAPSAHEARQQRGVDEQHREQQPRGPASVILRPVVDCPAPRRTRPCDFPRSACACLYAASVLGRGVRLRRAGWCRTPFAHAASAANVRESSSRTSRADRVRVQHAEEDRDEDEAPRAAQIEPVRAEETGGQPEQIGDEQRRSRRHAAGAAAARPGTSRSAGRSAAPAQ